MGTKTNHTDCERCRSRGWYLVLDDGPARIRSCSDCNRCTTNEDATALALTLLSTVLPKHANLPPIPPLDGSTRDARLDGLRADVLTASLLVRNNEPRELIDTHLDVCSRSIEEYAAEVRLSLDQLQRERDEARKFGELAAEKYNELLAADRTVRCAFCGEAYPDGTPASNHESLSLHIQYCVKHPMRELRLECDDARLALRFMMRDRRYHRIEVQGRTWSFVAHGVIVGTGHLNDRHELVLGEALRGRLATI